MHLKLIIHTLFLETQFNFDIRIKFDVFLIPVICSRRS
jgi:hypothetical protein